MRRYLNKAVAAIIASAMIMTSAGSVYADDVVSISLDSESVVSEVESADQNIGDEADDTNTEEIVSDGEVQAESTVTEGTEEVTPAEDETSGTCGENLTWVLEDGTLTISGTGDMEEFGHGSAPWSDDASAITKVVLETGVTSISEYAFLDCDSIISIEMQEGITYIGVGAFFGCASLESINIPESVTKIEGETFMECSNLTNIELPSGLTNIGWAAFYNCSNLININIPDDVTNIEDMAFYGCDKLTTIKLPSGLKTICSDVFFNCSSLIEVSIPDNVVQISEGAFSGCESLQSVTFTRNVKIIWYAFAGCSQLMNVYYKGTEEQWNAITVYGDTLAGVTVHYLDSDDIKSVSITGTCGENLTWSLNVDDSVLILCGNGAMDDYTDNAPWSEYSYLIEKVNIESGLTSIGNYAFFYCRNLISINIPSSVASIGAGAFCGCDSLISIDIPSSVTFIGNSAFEECSNLTSIEIPLSVKSIEAGTFSGCSNLTSIEIPLSVKSIGFGAFSGCDVLMDIYYNGSEEQWEAIDIDYRYSENDQLKSANIYYNPTPVVKPQITSQPVNATVGLKAKATFSVSAENVVSYHWQYSKNNGSTWSNLKDSSATSSFIGGTTTDTLTILTTNTRCGYVYRCQLTGENGDAIYTDTVTLSKIPELSITTQPVDTVGSLTKKTTFTVVAENAASYQWQYSKNSGTSWNTLKDSASSSTYIGGCTTDTLTLLVNSTRSGYLYRCKVTGQDGTVKYTDQAAILLFTITSQPESVQAKSGNTVTFSVGAENAESYQWYYQKEGSTTWNKLSDNTKSSMLISGSTSDTLTIKMTKTRLTFKYRCKVKGQDGTSKYTDTVEVLS